jgi:hypothetical protein
MLSSDWPQRDADQWECANHSTLLGQIQANPLGSNKKEKKKERKSWEITQGPLQAFWFGG